MRYALSKRRMGAETVERKATMSRESREASEACSLKEVCSRDRGVLSKSCVVIRTGRQAINRE